MTTRRSFLTLLGIAPIAMQIPAVAATAPASVEPTYGLMTKRGVGTIVGKIANADGSFVIDMDNCRMFIRGDMICDGSVVARRELDPRDYDDWYHGDDGEDES